MSTVISSLAKLDITGSTAKFLGTNQPAPQSAQTVITPAPPSATTTDQAANVQSQMDELRTRQGRAANALTGSGGVNNTPTGTKVLLGQ